MPRLSGVVCVGKTRFRIRRSEGYNVSNQTLIAQNVTFMNHGSVWEYRGPVDIRESGPYKKEKLRTESNGMGVPNGTHRKILLTICSQGTVDLKCFFNLARITKCEELFLPRLRPDAA